MSGKQGTGLQCCLGLALLKNNAVWLGARGAGNNLWEPVTPLLPQRKTTWSNQLFAMICPNEELRALVRAGSFCSEPSAEE